MQKTILVVVVTAIIFGGGEYWYGSSSAQSEISANRTQAGGNFAGRTGAGGTFAGRGGATFGTIISEDSSSITIQMPAATSTGAQSGSKIVLFDNSTQVSEMQNVPASNLKVGQTVIVAGTANSDGSLTAQSIQIRPAGSGFGGRGAGQNYQGGQTQTAPGQ